MQDKIFIQKVSISLKFCLTNLRQYKQRIIGKHKDKVIKNPLFNPVLIAVLGLLNVPFLINVPCESFSYHLIICCGSAVAQW